MKSTGLFSVIFVGLFYIFSVACVEESNVKSIIPVTNGLKDAMMKVADWQLNNFSTNPYWINAVFCVGVMALYDTTGQEKYLDAMLRFADANHWQPGPDFRNANDLAIGQLYTELFLQMKRPQMIEPFRERIDAIMKQPMPGRKDWWWCDALFMAPPALARLTIATGDTRYLQFMNSQWWDVVDFLYDVKEELFYRDATFFNKTEKNGKKVFWSRGNGWVIAAICRLLEFMPESPVRLQYIRLFREMASKLASIQQSDGFWRSSLYDPGDFPGGETSGTAFHSYAIAWGINQNILPIEPYVRVLLKAWSALGSAVQPSGKLDWVQRTGAAPDVVNSNDSFPYGAGAFLLAGSEMYKIIKNLSSD